MIRSAPSWWPVRRATSRSPLGRGVTPAAAVASTEDEPRSGARARWLIPIGAAAVILAGGVSLAVATPPFELGRDSVRSLTDLTFATRPKPAPVAVPAPIPQGVVSSSEPAPTATEAGQVSASSSGVRAAPEPSAPPAAATATATKTATAKPTASPSPAATTTASPSPTATATAAPTKTPSVLERWAAGLGASRIENPLNGGKDDDAPRTERIETPPSDDES